MSEYITKDSGERQEFETGARRDIQTGKPRFDLIPILPLRMLAELYGRGAEKYGDSNWRKGIPFRRVYASLLRHVFQWAEGDTSEDHLSAVCFNAMALQQYTADIVAGRLPAPLDDMDGKQVARKFPDKPEKSG